MGQKFYAHPTETFTWSNGAIGHRSGVGAFDCLGPYAKVRNCPVQGTDKRYTCYATGYADTMWTVPACTKIRGKHIRGYFAMDNDNIEFRVMDSHKHLVNQNQRWVYTPGDSQTPEEAARTPVNPDRN